MLDELRNAINHNGRTENGAVTLKSSLNHCLDLFATVGALRNASNDDIINRFELAFIENPDLAMKILFYARDVRGGLGERRVFKVILKAMANANRTSVIKNIPYIAEFGRYDDMLVLMGTSCEAEMLLELKRQFQEDMENLKVDKRPVSLLGKWLPSVNASNAETVANAKKIAKAFGLKDADYRKALTALRARIRIIENNLREMDYSFDYEAQPSRALFKYRKAFDRNDHARYETFKDRVASGEAKMHTAALAPYDIIKPILSYRRPVWYSSAVQGMSEDERRTLDLTWRNLPDYSGNDNTLVVVDGSGSMYNGNPSAISVAISLGIYMAEHINGEFKNHFITFSANPQLVEIKGRDIYEKVQYCMKFDEVANTNIEKVFRLILDTAVANHMTQDDMIKRIVIVSDMEFDGCAENASLTNFENAKVMFERAGFELPEIVFWNVQSRNTQQPVSMNDRGVALVSGCTPRLFSMIMEGEISPYTQMLEIIGAERYSMICA